MSPVVVAGAGGFIGGHLVKHLARRTCVRAVDVKPLSQWYQVADGVVENLCLDLSVFENCQRACEGAREVYQLAASMGGIGYIEHERVDCMRNVLINTHLLEAAYRAGVRRYFFSSSACVYNTDCQQDTAAGGLKESDAYPAKSERGYGWEKLYAEMLCHEYWVERGMKTFIARFHNCFGPYGTWDGGREKAPAAICRKVIDAKHSGRSYIDIWGDGKATRSYMWINDCVLGIDRIAHADNLVATPINLGSEEMVSVDALVDIVEAIASIKLERRYDLSAPKGVRGRNSDNTLIRHKLGWEPKTPLRIGLEKTYPWIEQQYLARKAGKRVVE